MAFGVTIDGNSTARTAENSAVLAASATRNGATQGSSGFSRFRAFASSDVAGTLNIQQSPDGGTTWYTTLTQTVAAGSGTGTVIESIVTLPHARAQYVNGATAQTAFSFASMLVGI